MKLKNLIIRNFEGVDRFHASFKDVNLVIGGEIASTILKAIGIVLQNKKLYNESDLDNFTNNTSISARVEIDGAMYSLNVRKIRNKVYYRVRNYENNTMVVVNFYNSIKSSPEEENLAYYKYGEYNMLSKKLGMYKDFLEFYKRKEFVRQTDGVGITRRFYLCLKNYIDNFEKERITQVGNKVIDINNEGNFVAKDGNGKVISNNRLTKKEKILFDYLCFLKINEFWNKMEAIRDYNHIKSPLFLWNILSDKDKNNDLLKKQTEKLKRQLFIFQTKENR